MRAIALAFVLLLAGCAAPDEATPAGGPPLACGPYETVHFEEAPGQAALRQTFEQAGYAWSARTPRIAEATGPAGGVVVLSHEPGPSGEELIVSAQGADAHRLAIAGVALVNATSDDARIRAWIAGNNC